MKKEKKKSFLTEETYHYSPLSLLFEENEVRLLRRKSNSMEISRRHFFLEQNRT